MVDSLWRLAAVKGLCSLSMSAAWKSGTCWICLSKLFHCFHRCLSKDANTSTGLLYCRQSVQRSQGYFQRARMCEVRAIVQALTVHCCLQFRCMSCVSLSCMHTHRYANRHTRTSRLSWCTQRARARGRGASGPWCGGATSQSWSCSTPPPGASCCTARGGHM